MNVCIIGAGNIGTYLATYISMKDNCRVWLHTSKPNLFKDKITLIEEEKNISNNVKVYCITDDLETAVKDADYILITHPSFLIEKTLKEISKFVKHGAVIGAIPGFGGKEYFIKELIEKGCIFFGSQRVPAIIRLESYGESVCLKKKNKFMKIRVIPGKYSDKVCEEMTSFIDINCYPLKSYLPITLSPSNPIMHPARLYELFKNYNDGETIYNKHFLFYEEWGDEASQELLNLDEELQMIFRSLNESNDFDEDDMEKIKSRYGIKTNSQLSEKIRNSSGFKGIKAPMVESGDGYIPDLKSRYFIEDIQFGLCIIKAFAQICQVGTPVVDKIIVWAQGLLDKEYVVNGKLEGKDIKELLIPQNRGIFTKSELISYYTNL